MISRAHNRQPPRSVVGSAGRPRLDSRLRELDVGRWSGLTRDEILELDPELLARFESEDPDARPGGGETRREIRARARRALKDILAERAGERIMIVSHLGFLRALLPGVEPANAELIRIEARAALALRPRHDRTPKPSSPL